ncbi:MAG: hypothetical protein IID45_12615 [Planctomycetes bacterium]|nr:hypothetical protein [Planctomycetota bacterium]
MVGEDADEVQRVGGREDDQFSVGRFVAQLPQLPDDVAGGELLAADAADETPAADFAPRFEPPSFS